MTNPSQNIIIVGGGLGGLALAQGLRNSGIPFTIFERDEAAGFRAQGYRIRINQDGGDALRDLLSPELFDAFEATCSTVVPGGHQINALTGQEDTSAGMPPQFGKTWNADRTVLRNVLLKGLENYIQFGKRFQRYELLHEGVRAYFEDGSSADGTMLIGVDGIRSQVRRQMLPESVMLETEGRAVFGKTPISSNAFDTMPEQINDGMMLVGKGPGSPMKLLTDMMRFHRSDNPDLPQDYIYWVLVFQRRPAFKSDTDVTSLTNIECVDLIEELTSDWHWSVRSIFAQQSRDATSALTLSMAKPPLPSWPANKRVIIIGDAAHAMPPVGGVGANAAFRDAAELLPVLQRGSSDLQLAEFERAMRDRCDKLIVQAGGGATRFFGMKPLEELKAVDVHK